MNKYIITCIAVLIVVLNVRADKLEISDQKIITPQATTFEVKLSNIVPDYVSFQMDLTLPNGVNINKDGCSLTSRLDEDEELNIGKIGENNYRIIYTSFSLTPISGEKGGIINLSLKATSESSGGIATLSNIRFARSNSTRVIMDNVTFNISAAQIIDFVDATVKSLCVQKFDKNYDGELDTEEAANVTPWMNNSAFGKIFKGNKSISSFNELQYFTGLGNIPSNSFCECTNLCSVVLPNNIESISSGAFLGCKLASLVIPNSVTTIEQHAFEECSSLTSLTVSNTLEDIGKSAFSGCSSLTSLVLPNTVTAIGESAFSNCSSLTSLTVSNTLEDIGKSAFSGCSSLTSLVLPNTVTAIGNNAFEGCSALTSINIPNQIEIIGTKTFYECENLMSIAIPNEVTTIETGAFQGCQRLSTLSLPNSVTSIGNEAFSGCTSLTALNIPKNVTTIGDGAFDGCGELTSIVVDAGNSVYDSRNNCNALIKTESNLLIRGCKNSNIPNDVTQIGQNAFYQCTGLTDLVIPNSVTNIGLYAFRECTNLTGIVLPSNISIIGKGAFYGCCSLVAIEIPSSLSNIDEYTFYGCSSLTYVDIPENITSIGSMAFASCSNLAGIFIPPSVTIMDGHVFENCSSLTRLKIPNSISIIRGYSFSGCTNLTSVEIPSSVRIIESYAFYGCNNLTSVLVKSSSPATLSYSVFSNTNNIRFYVPYACLAAYNKASYWATFPYKSEVNINTEIDNVSNVIYANSITGNIGRETTMTIFLKNSYAAKAYSFELELPDGVTIASNNKGDYVYELSSRHNGHSASVIYDNYAGVYCFYVNSSSSKAISNNSGAVLTLKLIIADNLDVGDYNVMIRNAEYNCTTGSSTQSLPYVNSTLIIENYIKGDVNNDGDITAQDASLVLQLVAKKINSQTAGIVYDAADVNGDEQVTAQDASLILQYVAKKITW